MPQVITSLTPRVSGLGGGVIRWGIDRHLHIKLVSRYIASRQQLRAHYEDEDLFKEGHKVKLHGHVCCVLRGMIRGGQTALPTSARVLTASFYAVKRV
jgi:hypothetical protein